MPIRIDGFAHGHYFDDEGDVDVVTASEETVVPLHDGQVVRPLITRRGMPLCVVESVLPELFGSFGGDLAIGAVIYSGGNENEGYYSRTISYLIEGNY